LTHENNFVQIQLFKNTLMAAYGLVLFTMTLCDSSLVVNITSQLTYPIYYYP